MMAKAVLARHNPKIVAITGSVGKTSAKAAVFAVLSSKFETRENQKNYNNEIGIPLTIIGAESGGRNIFKWIFVFIKWIVVLVRSNYPEFLVLELGVDRPNDMKYFMSFIKPIVGIVTNVSTSHLEYFKTIDNIGKEKGILIESLGKECFALLNGDDERTLRMSQTASAQVLTFGKSPSASVSASNIVYNYKDEHPVGISFKLNFEGKNVPIRLSHILAAHQVYAALAAIATGIVFKINLIDIAKSLDALKSPAGRMNLLKGINGSYLIDDTYNASPMSTVAAMDVLVELKSKRKIAVLGDMLELGDQTEVGHREVGRKIFSSNIDLLVAVGDRMKLAVDELISLGYPVANIVRCDNPELAGEKLQSLVGAGDFVLVKGSQGMRMEKILEKLLDNQNQASELLCRQSTEWKKKPFAKP